jgi:hypothetical protein
LTGTCVRTGGQVSAMLSRMYQGARTMEILHELLDAE